MKIATSFKVLLAAAAFGAGSAGPACASVRIYGEATSTGPEVNVQVFADISGPDLLSHSFKVFYPASQLNVQSASRNDSVWYFHDGTRVLPAPGPDTGQPGEVLFVSGHFDARAPFAGVNGNHVLLGSLVFKRSTPQTPNFDLTIGQAGQFASFVTTNGIVLEAQPGVVTVQTVTPDPNDLDLDGLRDKWEIQFFGTTRGVFYSDDPDGDGVNNLAEQAAGSDPTDPKSNLHLTLLERNGRMVLQWPSADKRVYAIEAAGNLGGEFRLLEGQIPATPPMNSFEFDRGDLGELMFFHVRVESAPTE